MEGITLGMPLLLIVIMAIAVASGFLNGIQDSSNVVAAMISSRALSPRKALSMTAVAELTGPFLFGVSVATTIGSDVVNPGTISSAVIIAALGSAILWNLFTWYSGLLSSHTLFDRRLDSVKEPDQDRVLLALPKTLKGL